MSKHRNFLRLLILCIVVTLMVTTLSICLTACGDKTGQNDNGSHNFTLTFEVDGGTYYTIFTAGNEKISLPTPTKTGYDFDGWYFDKDVWSNPLSANSFLNTALSSNMRVYAKWKRKINKLSTPTNLSYSNATKLVTWDAVENAVEYEYLLNDSGYTTSQTQYNMMNKDDGDYTFKVKAIGDGESYSDSEYAEITFTKGREEKTVTFDSKGGSNVDEITVEIGSKLTAPTQPKRNGYVFEGWYKEEGLQNLWSFDTDCVNSDITLYAKWADDPVGINSVEDATIDGTDITLIVEKDVEYVELAQKVILSSPNSNWDLCTDRLGQNAIRTKIAAGANGSLNNGDNLFYIVVSSQSDIKIFTLTIHRKFETTVSYYDFNQELISTDNVDTKSTLSTPSWSENIDGYTFSHWSTSQDTDSTPWAFSENGTTVEGETNLYAIYTPNQYTVSFDVNGGDNEAPADKTLTYGAEFTMPVPTRHGYTFIGWGSSTSNDATQYTDSEGNSLANWAVPQDKTVYAQWEANHYTVTTSTNMAEAGSYTTTNSYAYDSTVNLTANTNLGYTWLGWYDADGNKVDENSNFTYSFIMGSDDLSFEARWMICPITIRQNLAEVGYISGATNTVYCQPSTITAVTLYGNYEWIGWFDENDVKVSIDDNMSFTFTTTNEEKTYTAKWQLSNAFSNFEYTVDATSCIITGIKNKAVETVIIPNGVTSIGDQAFYECSGLTSITIPYSVTSIGEYAFAFCRNLTSVTIHDGVTSIGKSAFYTCSKLTSITIPNSVTNIGDYAFSYCSVLTTVNWNATACTIAGSIFTNCTSLTTVNIGDNVTTIPSSAFYGCSGFTSVTIPNSVISIGAHAFDGCSGLNSITIPDSVTSIGDYAFGYCSNLTSITIPDSVTSIGSSAFYGCNNLQYNEYDNACYLGNDSNPYVVLIKAKSTSITSCTINQNTKFIYMNAFNGCSGLTSITIPDSVTSIDYQAFGNCNNLTSITIGNNVTNIGGYAFSSCSELTCITIPDSVTSIGNSVFDGCSGLTSITISNNVTSIGTSAFYGCSNLQYNEYGNAYYLGDDANPYMVLIKAKSTDITSCIVNQNTKLIYYSAFSGCSNLPSITIPYGVTSIGTSAFSYCSGLTSIIIPDSVTSIGDNAFYNCNKLTSITIPNSVTSIGYNAFYNCSRLNAVYITDIAKWCGISFSNADTNPLYYAHNLYLNGELVTDLVIPDGVTNIGDYAFYFCSNLTSVTIPTSVTNISYYAFNGCSDLERITIANGNPKYLSAGNCIIEKSTKVLLVGCKASVIPTDGSVTTIGWYSFAYCKGLKGITIPNSVTRIAGNAFRGCTSLGRVTIYAKMASIGSYAFYDTALSIIEFNGTKAQWKAISKNSLWNYATPTYYTIRCTNGNLDKNDNEM